MYPPERGSGVEREAENTNPDAIFREENERSKTSPRTRNPRRRESLRDIV